MAKTQTEHVYEFIRTYIYEVGYPPHLREVAAHCALSRAKVVLCLCRLQASGRLTFREDRPRAIYLLPEKSNASALWEIQTAR